MSNIQNIDQHIIINVAERIERLIKDARQHINRIVDITEVITKYEIGHVIIEVVQEGEDRARYGKQLLKGVSEILTERLGEGWSVDTLKKCRKFYQIYSANKIGATLSPQLTIEDSGYSVAQIQKTATSQKLDSAYPFTLSWSHYVVLMRMDLLTNEDSMKLKLRTKIGVYVNCNDSTIQVYMSVWHSAKIKKQSCV